MYIFEEKLLSTKNPARQEPMYIFEEKLFSLNQCINKESFATVAVIYLVVRKKTFREI